MYHGKTAYRILLKRKKATKAILTV